MDGHDAQMIGLVRERLDELYSLRDDTEKLMWSERGRLSAAALEMLKGGIWELERLLSTLERSSASPGEDRGRYFGSPGNSARATGAF